MLPLEAVGGREPLAERELHKICRQPPWAHQRRAVRPPEGGGQDHISPRQRSPRDLDRLQSCLARPPAPCPVRSPCFLLPWSRWAPPHVELINTIVYYNGSSPLLGCSATHSDVEGGAAGTGNIDVVPGFVYGAKGNYTLQLTSQCINAGTPASGVTVVDITGGLRIKSGKVDIGAYEVR